LASALPQFHLEEAILCGCESLCEKKIVLVGCVDVRDSPVVTHDFDLLLHPAERDFSGDRRYGLLRARLKI
jgi:hypothetical protein